MIQSISALASASASVSVSTSVAGAGSSTATASLPLVAEVTFAEPLRAAVGLLLFACLAVLAAGGVAVTYRWYFRQRIPEGVAVLLGISAVVLYLNTASLGSIIGGTDLVLLRVDVVLYNVVAVGVAAAVAPAGAWTGDVVARNVFAVAGGKQLEGEIGRVVRTVGRVTPVTLPAADDIADMDSYEAVAPATKEGMAGRTLLFPRRVTVEELRDRLVARIKEDFGVNYVDVDVTQEGEIEYLAVGARAAGIGPTLAPGTAAIAVHADPPYTATPGDVVQVWIGGDDPRRVATAELRATAGDVATLALDETDAARLEESETYRLVTLPAEPQADREFASLLRAADETMTAVTIGPESGLVGTNVRDLEVVVAAVRPASGTIEAIPARDRPFEPGDTVFLLGRPDALRRVEAEAVGGFAGEQVAPDDAETGD